MKNEHIAGKTKVNTRTSLKKIIVPAVVLQLAFGQTLFALMTDRDFKLDNNTGDSPELIMQDVGDYTFILQKMDAEWADVINDKGNVYRN